MSVWPTRGVFAALVFMLSWGWLATLPLLTPAHDDTARNLLMARDCLEGSACVLAGPMSSFSGLLQGASSILGLSLILATAPGLAIELLTACFALSVALLFDVTWRTLSVRVALISTCLWLIGGVAAAMFPVLDVPLFLPLACVLTLLGAARYIVAPHDTAAKVLLTLGVTLTLNTHLAGLMMFPGALTLVLVKARRPVLEGALFSAAVAAATAVLSLDALRFNLQALSYTALLSASLGLALWTGASVALRASWRAEHILYTLGFLGMSHLALMAALSFAFDVAPSWRLAAPALPFLAIAGGALIAGLARHDAVAIIIVLGALGAFHLSAEELLDEQLSPVDVHSWSLEDIAGAAEALSSQGLSQPDRLVHLQGPRMPTLLASLAAFDEQRSCKQSPDREDWLVVRTTLDMLPTRLGSDVQQIRTSRGGVVLMRPIQSWLNREVIEGCLTVGGQRTCQELYTTTQSTSACEDASWLESAYPQLDGLRRLLPEGGRAQGPSTLSYSLRLYPTGEDTVRSLQLASPRAGQCAWRITGVSGTPATLSVDGTSVTLRQTQVPDEGAMLHLEKNFGGSCPDTFDRFLPSLAETRPDEVSLYSLVWSATPDG